MYILLPTIEYVHNINKSRCGMTGTPDHFWCCGCWLGPCCWRHRSWRRFSFTRETTYFFFFFFCLMRVKCCSCAIRLVKQPKQGWDVPKWYFLIELLGLPASKEEEERKKGEQKREVKRVVVKLWDSRRLQAHAGCTDGSGGASVLNQCPCRVRRRAASVLAFLKISLSILFIYLLAGILF